jgi:cysteine desulfurase
MPRAAPRGACWKRAGADRPRLRRHARDLVFTAGGTEANALAIRGLARGRRLLVGATEHPAVLAAAPGAEILPVHADGTLALQALEAALKDGPPALVCLMAANNETGVLHPVAEAAALCRAAGALLHLDAVQAAGRVPLPPGADSVALSGHKLGGPKGAGALLLRPGLAPEALVAGGGQERGRRGGTEPLPAIAGMAAAAEAARPRPARAWPQSATRSRPTASPQARSSPARAAPRLPNTTSLILPGMPAETQVIALDLAGVQVSAGAACSSGKVGRSHVLAAMGLGDMAANGIRVSLPWNASDDAAERFLSAWHGLRRRAA